MGTPQGEGPRTHVAVRIASTPKVGTMLVRFLGPYRGAMVHRVANEPRHCRGEDNCPRDRHRQPVTWKGYAAGEEYDTVARLWLPRVIEITENLEHQLRGRKLRGEQWILGRDLRPKNKSSVVGTYLENADPATLRPEFDITPVLCRLWHETDLVLDLPNPMVPRLLLEPSEGATPSELTPTPTLAPAHVAEIPAQVRQELLDAMNRQMGKAPRINGTSRHDASGKEVRS